MTEDGYILALHRIPQEKGVEEEAGQRPLILVQHGILCSSADWVMSDPAKALGFGSSTS